MKVTTRHVTVVAFVMAALVLGLVLRGPLQSWFGGAGKDERASGAMHAHGSHSMAGHGTTDPHAASAVMLSEMPGYRFEDTALHAVREAFDAYEKARAQLANDTLDGLEVVAEALERSLGAARVGSAQAPGVVAECFTTAAKAASALGASRTIEEARHHFSDLSMTLVAFGAADPRVTEGWRVYRCPMVMDRFPKWFQRGAKLENPYMGQSMPSCGTSTSWTIEPPATTEQATETNGEQVAYYTCAMHPSVRQATPGNCPICSMQLTPVTEAELATGTIFVDEVRRQRIGVRTEPVARRSLTLGIRAVGAVGYDETRLADVNLRVSGWVQKLRVAETGQRVRRGQELFTLYSPELYAAQLEHLSALRREREGAIGFADLTRASRQRLLLLGMTEKQVGGLEERGEAWENVPVLSPAGGYVTEKNVVEGARVEAGSRVYRIADLSRVWIDAEVYESDLPHVRVGQTVVVELPYVKKPYTGHVDYVYPMLHGETRTARVRVALENADLELKPDMYANVRFEVELGDRLAVPESAVLYTGPRRLVFVDLGEGRLRPREVRLGVHAGGFYEIESGLEPGEVVVTSANFLIAAESRIRSAVKYWETNDGK